MILEVDNKGGQDLIKTWSVGKRTKHVDVLEYFFRDFKEDGVLCVH
jgi:hypothetical protein